jgi:hypothetical protein
MRRLTFPDQQQNSKRAPPSGPPIGVGRSGHIRAAVALLAQIDRLAKKKNITIRIQMKGSWEEALRARVSVHERTK